MLIYYMLSENLIKGQLIELKVQEELLRYGFDISVPTYNASRYDLIADTGTEILKIQIKKAIGSPTKVGSFSIRCTSQNVRSSTGGKHKYTSDEVDYFATVWKDKVYLIPLEETSNQKTLREDDSTYLAENIFSAYHRLSDEELYNYAQPGSGKHYCIDCGCEISSHGERCAICASKAKRVIERPTRDELKILIRSTPFITIGKQYGVTDNTIRKWCKSMNLPSKAGDIKQISEEEWKSI